MSNDGKIDQYAARRHDGLEQAGMQHIVEECGDDTGALRNLVQRLGKDRCKIVQVLWMPARPGAKPGYVVIASKD